MSLTTVPYPVRYENDAEITYSVERFTAKQLKNKFGTILEKVYFYTNNGGGADYYDTTAFATFSSWFHVIQFIKEWSEN